MGRMEHKEYLALAEHLIGLGCPLDLSQGYRDTPDGLRFEQIHSGGTNQVLDLYGGGSGYIVDVRLSSRLNLPMRIRKVALKTPWGVRNIKLLPDSSELDSGYECYEFPGEGLIYPREGVINDFLSGKSTLNPNSQIDGLLLAVDEGRIPDAYREHGRTTVDFSIFDERGNMFTSSFRLCVDRSATVFQRRREEKRSMDRDRRTRGAA